MFLLFYTCAFLISFQINITFTLSRIFLIYNLFLQEDDDVYIYIFLSFEIVFFLKVNLITFQN